MEGFLSRLKASLNGIKKLVVIMVVGIAGLLLTLAGVNLIQLSESLILYSGVSLLLLTALLYWLL